MHPGSDLKSRSAPESAVHFSLLSSVNLASACTPVRAISWCCPVLHRSILQQWQLHNHLDQRGLYWRMHSSQAPSQAWFWQAQHMQTNPKEGCLLALPSFIVLSPSAMGASNVSAPRWPAMKSALHPGQLSEDAGPELLIWFPGRAV